MGFNKRYLNKEIILSNLSNIDKLLKADGLIMDMWSSYFISDLNSKQRDLRKILIEDTQFDSSGNYQNHKNFYLLSSISEAIINLSTDPSWLDIQIVCIKTGFKTEEDEKGKFYLLRKKAIESAITYYDNLVINGRDETINQVLS
jgi:hypothetical protein